MIGTSLGPYRIVAPLGAGGMGEVYRARDERLGAHIYSDKEPNNSIGTAQPILLPVEIVGAKNAADNEADVECFAVNLQAGQTLTALVVADLMGSSFDGTIFLFDSVLTTLARSDNWIAGIKDPGFSYALKSSGLYYVVVASGTGADTSGASYRLFLTAR